MKITKVLFLLLLFVNSSLAWQLDKKVAKSESAFWEAHYNIPKYSACAILALSLVEGTQSRIGKTSFESLDAGIISQVLKTGIKKAAGRTRPKYTDSPDEWREGGESFPSGHVSGMTALVTPYILEYQDDKPWIHLLWSLPAYQMAARVKVQEHWQSDVIAGALLGFASGYITHNYNFPILLYFAEDHAMVGLKYRF